MSGLSVGEITYFFFIFAIVVACLTILLLMTNGLILISRHRLRRHLASTDLDLVGREATVVKTIRPKKTGQILCRTANGERLAEAVSDEMIKKNSIVLITAADKDRFRVRSNRQDTPT